MYERNAKGKYLFTKEQKNNMLEMYDSGMAIYKIAKEYGVGFNVIRNVVTESKREVRGNEFYARKYTCNSEYFDKIDTEDKAYWLGFVYADGYITQRRQVGIALSTVDEDHLYKFKDTLEATNPIHRYSSSSFGEPVEYCRIIIEDDTLWSDLQDKGVLLNKTNELKFPTEDVLPNHLKHHFIRGYWDGDGSIYETTSGGCTSKYMSVLGTRHMVEEIRSFFGKEDVSFAQRHKDRDVNNWTFAVGGNLQVPRFLNTIYKDATIYLDRKYEIYKKFTT